MRWPFRISSALRRSITAANGLFLFVVEEDSSKSKADPFNNRSASSSVRSSNVADRYSVEPVITGRKFLTEDMPQPISPPPRSARLAAPNGGNDGGDRDDDDDDDDGEKGTTSARIGVTVQSTKHEMTPINRIFFVEIGSILQCIAIMLICIILRTVPYNNRFD